MTQSRMPRRPSILSPARAEAIVGDEDPAAMSALAQASAWALMGVEDEDFGPDEVARLRRIVRSDGVDVVAHLWSRAAEFTLPGALWRLHLLAEWYARDPALVRRRYEEGARAPVVPGLEPPLDLRPVESVIDEVGTLLRGDLTDDDLDRVLSTAAKAMRVIAAGEGGSGSWIEDPRDRLAHPVTTRARALLRTAEELDRAAAEAAVGALD